ncbi:DOMON-like domain-containing protein [Caulobacter mirabilis]|uniref:DOMON-like domain-containing protein n=1 Tax=Caulobacter mirabilis TaxID=69666 RepID=A0A2D2AYX5_9CAUL|nr:DOMON-like domain-containing protein [Caulobacter mirabilis]ATQ43182.1 hypothetical protein CSW64_12535 [Caulobacter mirabilis]
MTLALTPHPLTPCEAVETIAVNLARSAPAGLALRFVVTGDIAGLRLPRPVERGRADELWRTTCFEAFLRKEEGAGYYEFNLSPSNRWAAYGFDGYRDGMTAPDGVAVTHMTQRTDGRLYEMVATMDLAGLSDLSAGDWRLGLSAVIEEADGRKSYWALAHAPDKPDFHHPAAFAYDLEPA